MDKALSEAGRRRLLNRWLGQWAVPVRRRSFEVYQGCMAGSEVGSQEEEGEVIDHVAGVYQDCLAGSEVGSQEEEGEVIDLVAGATDTQ